MSVFFYVAAKNFNAIEILIHKSGFAGPIVAILLYGLLAATPISTDPITLISGVLFGPVIGIFISWMGNNFAALIEYYVGGHISKLTKFDNAKTLPFGLSKLPISSPFVLIFGRMIPGYGGKIISIMAGMYKVPVRTYVWTSALTNFLGSLLLSLGGYGLKNIVYLNNLL